MFDDKAPLRKTDRLNTIFPELPSHLTTRTTSAQASRLVVGNDDMMMEVKNFHILIKVIDETP